MIIKYFPLSSNSNFTLNFFPISNGGRILGWKLPTGFTSVAVKIFFSFASPNGIVAPVESYIGQLSKSSSIAKAMDDDNLSTLNGFYISDIFYWTYEDTLRSDEVLD